MIQFEAWLSLVERRVRDAEAASSNLVASMTGKLRNLLKISKFRSFRLCYRQSGMIGAHLHERPASAEMLRTCVKRRIRRNIPHLHENLL